jgi:hypothetical protein
VFPAGSKGDQVLFLFDEGLLRAIKRIVAEEIVLYASIVRCSRPIHADKLTRSVHKLS